MAQTTLPLGPGDVQPHSSHSDDTTCSPRPDSPNQSGSLATGTSSLGSDTAHSTHGPGCSRPSRTGQRGQTAPGQGTVYRSALVSSSDTTTTMSSDRSPSTPQRRSVAAVKSRATRTDSAPRSAADASQCQSAARAVPHAKPAGTAVTAASDTSASPLSTGVRVQTYADAFCRARALDASTKCTCISMLGCRVQTTSAGAD